MTAKRLLLATAATLAVGAAGPAMAEGGLPQLDPKVFAPQAVWLAISFGLLYYIMSKVALPKIGAVVENRRQRIEADLAEAAKLKAESDAIMAEYQKVMADARAEARSLAQSVADAATKAATSAQDAVTREIAAQAKEAEARIDAAKNAALSNVRSIAVDVAEAAVSRLSGEAASRSTVEAAVDTAMQGRR